MIDSGVTIHVAGNFLVGVAAFLSIVISFHE